MLGDKISSRLHCEIGKVHSTTHDPDFIFVFNPTHIVDEIVGRNERRLRSTQLQLLQPAIRWLLYADAAAPESTMSDSLNDPAHPVHRPGKIKIRLIIP